MLLKPQITFPVTHGLSIWNYIKSEFDKCVTESDFIEFTLNCQKEADISKNEIRKDAYQRTFETMHQIITGRSYNSLSIPSFFWGN